MTTRSIQLRALFVALVSIFSFSSPLDAQSGYRELTGSYWVDTFEVTWRMTLPEDVGQYPAVLWCHGGSGDQTIFEKHQEVYSGSNDLVNLAITYPPFCSDGQGRTGLCNHDERLEAIDLAVDLLNNDPEVLPGAIVIYGQSGGGATVVDYAVDFPDAMIAGIWTCYPADARFMRKNPPEPEKIAAITVPWLNLVGQIDFSLEHSQEYEDALALYNPSLEVFMGEYDAVDWPNARHTYFTNCLGGVNCDTTWDTYFRSVGFIEWATGLRPFVPSWWNQHGPVITADEALTRP